MKIELDQYGSTAIIDGEEYQIRSFDYAGCEALVIHDLDLISYDDGDSWQEMD
tara:strand:- start:66 stop:224 length:159 start_codon:yes stop_codon:yes gene_type:complete